MNFKESMIYQKKTRREIVVSENIKKWHDNVNLEILLCNGKVKTLLECPLKEVAENYKEGVRVFGYGAETDFFVVKAWSEGFLYHVLIEGAYGGDVKMVHSHGDSYFGATIPARQTGLPIRIVIKGDIKFCR